MKPSRSRIRDVFALVAIAFAVCAVVVGTFLFAEIRGINGFWVYLAFVSVGFCAGVREEYRRELRNIRFLLFVAAWVVLNICVIVAVLGTFGWLALIPLLFVEQVLFYISAHWLFGFPPPWTRSSARNE